MTTTRGKGLTLGEAIKLVLCDVARALHPDLPSPPFCTCKEPWPQTYRCAYGDCEYLRCERCGRIYRIVRVGRCSFPYTQR
jgi:hypothetical protein